MCVCVCGGGGYRQLGPILCLKDCHGSQRARAHGGVRNLVGRAMRMDGVQMNARGINAAKDQGGPNVASVAKELLFEHRHGGH